MTRDKGGSGAPGPDKRLLDIAGDVYRLRLEYGWKWALVTRVINRMYDSRFTRAELESLAVIRGLTEMKSNP